MAGIHETDKIDLIADHPEDNRLCLFMVETREWSESQEMYLELQEKLSTYLTYIDCGKLYEDYPGFVGKGIRFMLCYFYPLNDIATSTISRMETILFERNIELVLKEGDPSIFLDKEGLVKSDC
ncbi:MAG: hypothetical protein MI750_11405 [Xanthomonadales bacterium]|nr:hypothetical protein [Xanthomonadales bacterium]